MNAIKKYWNSVYLYVLLLVPGFCMCAGIFWTTCKALGFYPNLAWIKILCFDFSQMLYLATALFFIFKNRQDKTFIPRHLISVKGFIVIALFIQYNFILYLFPSTHVWGCTFLFFAIIVFLFDSKLMLINSLSYGVSLVTAHLLHPEDFLPLEKNNLAEVIAFRTVIFVLTAFCITIIVYFVEKFLLQAKESDEENLHLMQKQLEYYKDMDLMDTELRKFRHDIRNHFTCIQALFLNGKVDEAQSYFESLQHSYSFEKKMVFSGNDIIDAILHHELPHHCREEVKVTVFGCLPILTTVSSIDLCTLFSNLLSNAITSANECADRMNAHIIIQFSGGEKYFSIRISNSLLSSDSVTKRRTDDRNHGHGMHKIKEVLEKYDGKMSRHMEPHTLTTTIFLPI